MYDADVDADPRSWQRLLRGDRVVPVYTPGSVAEALSVGAALQRGGLHSIEITLRTPIALDAVRELSAACPDLAVGAGTVQDSGQLEQVKRAGASFAVSPGTTPELMRDAKALGLPYLPGVATASELMAGLTAGYRFFKMFPAEPINALALLGAWAGPFAMASFCPTGGIDRHRAEAYLRQANVVCVGGSWLTPADIVMQGDWSGIESRAAAAAALTSGP